MARPDYPRARWYGAYHGNYSSANRPSSNRINKVVIHVVQGSFSSAINWFNDSRAGVSAHYTVRSSDGFVGQSVEEKDIAYHAGNWPVNQTAIGIEHEGFGDNPARWFTPEMYNSSARLTAYLCNKYNIPVRLVANSSQAGILAHRQATSTACPGRFDLNRYIRLVRQFAGSGGGTTRSNGQVIDNSARSRFAAPRSWSVNTWNTQKYGPSYAAANPHPRVVNPARFKVSIPRQGRYTIFARWPAHYGYNPRTTFRILTTRGFRNKVVNQRRNGGRWVNLGTYEMRRGFGWFVQVSRKSPHKGFVIADAIKVVPR